MEVYKLKRISNIKELKRSTIHDNARVAQLTILETENLNPM